MVRRARQRGFTLIELMISLVILGILFAVAIPAYMGYTTRAQVSEGISSSLSVRRRVEIYWTINGSLPDSNNIAGLDPPADYGGKYVGAVTVTPEGAVEVSFVNGALAGGGLKFTPTFDGGTLVWLCQGVNIAVHLLTKECR